MVPLYPEKWAYSRMALCHPVFQVWSDFDTVTPMTLSDQLITLAHQLSQTLSNLSPNPPVSHIYNPLDYAREAYNTYLRRFARQEGVILFMGMNPGPDGMAQTGIPFGAVNQVTQYLGITEGVTPPRGELLHPKKPVTAFKTTKIEPSGNRLWGLFRELFPDPADFFREHLVLNFCPLLFLNQRGANVPPDKLPAQDRGIITPCDQTMAETIRILRPRALVGIGNWAYQRFVSIKENYNLPTPGVHKILHPSPASPAANRGWYSQAAKALYGDGLWPRDYYIQAQSLENRIKTGK